jgi:hypothetical protein
MKCLNGALGDQLKEGDMREGKSGLSQAVPADSDDRVCGQHEKPSSQENCDRIDAGFGRSQRICVSSPKGLLSWDFQIVLALPAKKLQDLRSKIHVQSSVVLILPSGTASGQQIL